MKNRAALWTVYVCITVYSMSFMAQVPVLPYLLQDLGSGSSASFGAVQTAFSLAQLFGGLISGSLLDRWGPQAMLIISLSSAVANYGFTASAQSLNALYISRVFTVMQHALLAARTYVSAVAAPEVRVKYLSILSVFNSVGFAAGPALGGVLTKFGVRTAAWASTLASALSIVAVMIMVPSRTPQVPKHTPATVPDSLGPDDDEKPKKKTHSWLQPLQVLKYPAVRQLMMINLVYNLAYGLSQSVFALMLRTQYNLASEQNGMVLSYQGALGMFSQAFLVEPAKRYLGEGGAVYAGCVTMACSYLLMAATAGSVPGLLLAMFPCAAGSAMLSTVLTAQLTRAGPQQTVGSVLALDMSLFAAVRLFTPSAGTALLYFGGTGALGCAAAGLLACLLLIVQLGWVRCDGGLPPVVPKETIVKSYAQHSTSASGPSCQAGPSSNALLPGVSSLAPGGAPVAGAGYYQFNSGQQEGPSRGDSGGGAPISPHGAWVRWSSQGVAAQRTMAPIRARIAP